MPDIEGLERRIDRYRQAVDECMELGDPDLARTYQGLIRTTQERITRHRLQQITSALDEVDSGERDSNRSAHSFSLVEDAIFGPADEGYDEDAHTFITGNQSIWVQPIDHDAGTNRYGEPRWHSTTHEIRDDQDYTWSERPELARLLNEHVPVGERFRYSFENYWSSYDNLGRTAPRNRVDSGMGFAQRTDNGVEVIDNPVFRTCTKCGNERLADERAFYVRRRNDDGTPRVLSSWCRECTRKHARTRRTLAKHGRRFGVEIEVEFPRADFPDSEDIASILNDRGVECRNDGYNHTVHEGAWKIVSDGSIDGWELVSPPMLWKDREAIEVVTSVLRDDFEATATRACGLHVHHEVADFGVEPFKRLVQLWREQQGHTNRLVSPARRDGQWCAEWDESEVEYLMRANDMQELRRNINYVDRYRALNLTCFNNYSTVEVRQHQGTLDPNKIYAWIAYGQAMIEAAASGRTDGLPIRRRTSRATLHQYLDNLPFRPQCDTHREFLKSRAVELAR